MSNIIKNEIVVRLTAIIEDLQMVRDKVKKPGCIKPGERGMFAILDEVRKLWDIVADSEDAEETTMVEIELDDNEDENETETWQRLFEDLDD